MLLAQTKWRKLEGANFIPEIIQGLNPRAESSNFKIPPDNAVTNVRA